MREVLLAVCEAVAFHLHVYRCLLTDTPDTDTSPEEQEKELERLYATADEKMMAYSAAHPGQNRLSLLTEGKSELFCITFELCLTQLCGLPVEDDLKALGCGEGVTMALAKVMADGVPFSPLCQSEELWQCWEMLNGLLLCKNDAPAYYDQSFRMDVRLLEWLIGSDRIEPRISHYTEVFSPQTPPENPIFIGQALLDRLEPMLSVRSFNGRRTPVQVAGRPGSGRFFLLRQAAFQLGQGLLAVDVPRFCTLSDIERGVALWLLCREAWLTGFTVCLRGFTAALLEAKREEIRQWFDIFKEKGHAVALTTEENCNVLATLGVPGDALTAPNCGRLESLAVWRGFWAHCGIRSKTVDCEDISARYHLLPGHIRIVCERLAAIERAGNSFTMDTIADVCYTLLPAPEGSRLRRIESGLSIDDLILPPRDKATLMQICSYMENYNKVFVDWNISSRYTYGTGAVALFCGPPGTGKTMAANVLSRHLRIALMTVDLSRVMDKYIGETEKKLEAIFEKAERSNVILFFDEADAIFGRRSQVNESKDRYANSQVSYILQRIEQYDGLVILSTNLRNNFDPAFMRRIRYQVDFPMPSAAMREQIWKGCIPPEVPAETLELHALAELFEISGGIIKNIVLSAVFDAAGEKRPLSMLHLLRAVRDEWHKQGKILLATDLGPFQSMFSALQAPVE